MPADTALPLDLAPIGRSNAKAALIVLVAFAVFSGTDAMVKLLSARLAVPQVTFMITATALVLLGLQSAVKGTGRSLVPRYPVLAFLRALLLAGDTLLIYYAFAMLPLAEAYLLAFLTPVLVAILAFVLLGERLSAVAWGGVLIGFLGVAVALQPGVAPLNSGHAAALGSALLFALSLILLRRTKAAESDRALVASLLVVLTIMAFIVAVANGGLVAVTAFECILALGAGLLLLAGHALLVRAFRTGDAAVVSSFQYSQIIWGCLYGSLLFAAPIELHTLAGAGIIILSGWLVLR
jgi:S-adenosylmethionine uptake transporter